jgi:hypothetical protein
MSNRKLWLEWVLASTLGWAIAFSVAAPTGSFAHWITRWTVVVIALSILMGAILGLGQWIVLRQHMARANYWVFASAIGFGIGLTLSTKVAIGHDVVTGVLLGHLVLGSVLGLAQWITLQRRLRETIFWMLASVLGWSIGNGVADTLLVDTHTIDVRALFGFNPVPSAIAEGMAIGTVVGAIYGVITGTVLIWILNDVRRNDEIPSLPAASLR